MAIFSFELNLKLLFVVYFTSALARKIAISPSGGVDRPGCGNNFSNACNSLDFVLSSGALDNTSILLGKGEYILKKSYSFSWLRNFRIAGEGLQSDDVRIVCNWHSGNGSLAFYRSSNITLEQFAMSKCGDWRSSTKITKKSILAYKYFRFVTALHFDYCTDIVLSGLKVSKTHGLALNIYDAAGVTRIYDCLFTDNKAAVLNENETVITRDGHVKAGGGIFIQQTRFGSNPLALSAEEHNRHVSNNQFQLINCSFIGNEAPRAGIYDTTDTPESPFSRGGGFAIYLHGNTSNNLVQITSCSFHDNRAQWGGGLQFEAGDMTENNYLMVKDTIFEQNFAAFAGGGARVGSVNPAKTKVLAAHKGVFRNCRFLNNTSEWGGGISIYAATRLVDVYSHTKSNNSIVFANCHWLYNKGNVGSATAAFLWNLNDDGIGPSVPYHVELQSCTFQKNDAKLRSYDASLGQGAVYSVQVPIQLYGNTTFTNNSNTALALDAATIEISGQVIFQDNRGYVGGAVSMYGRSKFVFYKKSRVLFVGNRCLGKGGAIFVATSGPPFVSFNATGAHLHRCFFVYEDLFEDFDNWDVEIVFRGNRAPTAQSGNSVYATTLMNCRRVGEHRSNNTVLNWKTVKFFDELGNETNPKTEVSTDAINILYNSSDWHVAPGQTFNTSVDLIDEKGNVVYGIVHVDVSSSEGSSNVELGTPSPLFLSNRGVPNVQITGKEKAPFNVTLRTLSGPLVRKLISNIKLKPCNPGFRQSGSTCICNSDIDDGITYCSKEGLRVYIRKGYWAGQVDGEFVTFPCPDNYCQCRNESHVNTGECLYIEGKMCANTRDGNSILCGECESGYSALLGSEMCSPSCSNLYLLLLIPYGIILLVLVMGIMAINLDVFTGYLNAWLFSYQVISLLTKANMPHFDPFITFVIGIANLQFKIGRGSCLVHGIDEVDKLMIMYSVPTYVLLLVFVLAKVIRIYPNWFYSRRVKAPFRALCTLFVLCYTNITGISLKILHFAKLGDRYVLYQNGELEFFRGKHIAYGLVAIAYILVIVIPVPLFLMFTPFFVKKGQKYFRINLNTFKPIYDALQGCFKDEYRWFSAFYFVCRLLLLLVATYIPIGPFKRSVLEISSVLILLFFVYIKPYQQSSPSRGRVRKVKCFDWINKSDTVLLANLCLVAVLSTSYDDSASKDTRDGVTVIVNALAYVPLFVLLAVIGRVMRQRWLAHLEKTRSFRADRTSVTQEMTTEPLD